MTSAAAALAPAMTADASGARTTDVVVAWWADGARRHHTCTASLDAAREAAAPAFEEACQVVAIDGDA